MVHLPKLISDELGTSRSEARRLLSQGAVKLNGKQLGIRDQDIDLPPQGTIEVGRMRKIDL